MRPSGFKVATVVLVAVSVMHALDSRAQEQPSEAASQDAQALAKAMQLEKVVMQGFEAAVERQAGGNALELECLRRADVSFVNDIYAAAFAKTLTAEEMQEAVAFFDKPVGQWYLDYSTAIGLQSRGVTSAAPKADISAEMYADFEKFMDGTAGKKLLEGREYESAELKNALGAKMMPIVFACKQEAAARQGGAARQ